MIEKIIRDNLVEVIPPEKIRMVVNKDEHVRLLIEKLFEESQEIKEAYDGDSIDDFHIEVADLLSVIDHLILLTCKEPVEYIHTHNMIEQIKRLKISEHGGFYKGVVLKMEE